MTRMIRWAMNGLGQGFGYLIHGRRLGKWAGLLLLAGSVQAATPPLFPTLMIGSAAAVATASVSVSVYADTDQVITISATAFHSHGPIREWSIQAAMTGSATGYWTVDLEVSNDDAVWTRILRHTSSGPAAEQAASGSMVWANHRTARRARLNLSSVGAGCHVTATAYGEPGCP